MDLNEMRLKFDNAILLLIVLFVNDEYCDRIEEIKQSEITLSAARKRSAPTKVYMNIRKSF